MIDFAVAGKDSSEEWYTSRGGFAGTGSELQGDRGRRHLSLSPQKPNL